MGSQLSDIYSSSVYEGGSSERFPYPIPDDSFMLDPPSSQRTLTSVTDTELIQPPPIPIALERVGPDRHKSFVLYTEMSKDDFLHWWLQTEQGSKQGSLQVNADDSENVKKLHWDGTGNTSDIWTRFKQIAHYTSGLPKVMCERCGKVLEHPNWSSNGTHSLRRHWEGPKCQKSGAKANKQPHIRQLIKDSASHTRDNTIYFSKERWEQQIMKTITVLRLPFQIVEHPELQSLLRIAQSAPFPLEFPSAKTVQRRIRDTVKESHKTIIQNLPPNAKLSIALDCWTSPFSQAFMAITGYFIDKDWNYREILLGFQPLQGAHSGANLSAVLLKIFQQHQIVDRVLAVTTDNASNNNTLITSIQESIQALELDEQITIIRIPCIAHVIQLSLNKLLSRIKANPKNQVVEREWSESRSQALRSSQRNKEIANTLEKIRGLAVFINGSPQRRDAFLSLQTEEPKLVPIQDVRTRWNSTFLMLRRAKRLQPIFDEFCSHYGHPHLMLDREEWRQIDYLLYLTKPFFEFTTALSQTKDATIHSVFGIYSQLFNHLEISIGQLEPKQVAWKRLMVDALYAAKDKLSQYYNKIAETHNNLYAIGTILAPQYKLGFFEQAAWADRNHYWRTEYHNSLKEQLKPYQQRLYGSQSTPIAQSPVTQRSRLQFLLTRPRNHQSIPTPQHDDELSQYLKNGTVEVDPLTFWRENERQYPVLASLARDILSIPATGAGVERLFNSARDICHYRRGSLNATTIQDLMMFMCATRFDIEEKQLAFVKDFLTKEEQEIAAEENDAQFTHDDLNELISDDEEEDHLPSAEDGIAFDANAPRTSCKRRRNDTPTEQLEDLGAGKENEDRDEEEDEDDDLPVGPAILEERSTQREPSKRRRIRSRLLDGYEVDM
ncbi:uncharacterized protein N7525_007394 [Penicillium rubens]|uniref:uncharacterized protein n=1 Tax=Penicillium rubens TaxID=1108849 RepID=UPI002396C0EF|nr:uncharacterized protein N7525_007394 [Penicillium rubens]KAJ5253812.1 hypothetical protein N7524_010992 [Penicillium chrysogenum]KAJ5265203.1 hypothetical protein N7524_006221 [Penicillium chrysogenum]KAJ5829141.1 hypothetical protein N7525_007394 [Penicillium rubens]KAJ5858319.1 hypothetical protein N7534_003596 [Penicillium rubens]